MARIAGINLPAKKRIEVALTYIYGIGPSRARQILQRTRVDPNTKVMDLTEQEVTALRREVEACVVEGDLRRQVRNDIQRLIDIGCYRGIRHKVGLPVRGQKTQSNARTWKGPRPAKAGKRK
ncbi:MAG: 30S ribosomal protein S13 [Candidatus Acetothermia bacterium]|jgi:small subunit ribosomal protein S13|nr:30S ribosomal protein S13 [Candidatus Acetothermia bacterium]